MATVSTEEFLDNPPFPKILQFETATTCNAHCLMCPHDKMKRRGTAKWSLISKVIREAVPQVETVCPFLMQEPTLEPRLVSILANIKQRNQKCTTAVYSNMAYLPNKTLKQIVDYDLLDELHISFYGPTEALYEKWQPPLKRAVTVKNIQKLFVYRHHMKRLKPKITLHVLSVPEIIEASSGYKDVVNFVDKVGNVQFDTFHGDIPDYGGDQTEFMGRPPKPRTPCQRLWSGINIHFDGSVVPCCIDYNDENVMGNVGKDSLADVWGGLNLQKFRRLHMERRWNEIDMCRECKVHEYQFSSEWVDYWLSRE